MSKQGEKSQRQKVPFLWQNMREYRVLIWFFVVAVFSINLVFVTILAFFLKFLKKDNFQKSAY